MAQKQPKSYLKSSFFFRIAYVKVTFIFMSFGTKMFAHFRIRSHQTFNFHFTIYTKMSFLELFKFECKTLKLRNIFQQKFLKNLLILL